MWAVRRGLRLDGVEGPACVRDALEPVRCLSDVLLKETQWTQMFFGEGQACLSFSHLNKDDEGLYTLRIVSRGGVSDHSAYLFVRGRWGRARFGGSGVLGPEGEG